MKASASIIFAFVVLPLFFITPTHAQTEADSLKKYRLDEVTVVAYDGNRRLLETPGAISVIPVVSLSSYSETSVVQAFNSVSGIRLEERAPGSYRVAIRGSSLRAPFGVRNVKIYWNDIPFTQPSGGTPFNLLDVSNFGKVEVIKGPAGSTYGAGTGGAVLINSFDKNLQRNNTAFGTSFGSFGLQRYTVESNNRFENGVISAKYARQLSDGYREQSFFQRDVLELSSSFDVSNKRQISAHLLYSDLNYGIPGGLNEAQFDANPRQARQGNPFVLGSVESNASIDQEAVLLGVSQRYSIRNDIENTTTVYGLFSDFVNPFNFDFKRDSRKTAGGRTNFTINTHIGDVQSSFVFGGEFQRASNVARNFETNNGAQGDLNFDDELRNTQSILFAKAEFDLPADWVLNVGASVNTLEYDINRVVDNENNAPGRVVRDFNTEFIPRIGVSKKLNTTTAVHGSISIGFSPPTIEEVRTNEGSINTGLEAEKGINYEIGIRGNTLNGRLNYDVTGFFFKLDETIVQTQSLRGTTLFVNTGDTDQFGLEVNTNFYVVDQPEGFIRRLEWQVAYTRHAFKFNNFVDDGDDFSGNDLTGVAPNILVTSLNAISSVGLYGQLSYNFTDEIPLNDENTVFSDSYNLVQLKGGFRTTISEAYSVDLFFGMDNLLDETYSLGNDLNAFGGRFFQPAAERNFYGGLKLNIQL